MADPTPYNTGRHAIGLGNSFILFPKTAQRIAFASDEGTLPINVRAAGIFNIDIEVVFWYRLKEDKLFDLYTAFKTGYEPFFIKSARSILRDVAASDQFDATAFSSEDGRLSIEQAMREALAEDLEASYDDTGALVGGGAELVGFQLRRIFLPPALETQKLNAKIVDMQRQVTDVETELVRIVTDTNALLTEMVSQKNKEVSEISEATTNRRVIIDQARVAIEEETNKQVAKIQSDLAAQLQVFNQDTTNKEVQAQLNVSVTQQTTSQLAAAINVRTNLLRAAKNEELKRIEAAAAAQASLVVQQAEAGAQIVVSEAIRESFAAWRDTLGFTAEEINVLEWTDAMAEQAVSKMFLDMQKPSVFELEGQAAKLSANI